MTTKVEAAKRHVLVVSSINRDQTFYVKSLPLPGETVLSTSITTSLGGKGANTAVAAAKTGAPVYFLGAVGPQTDVLSQLSTYDVDVTHVTHVENDETGSAVILLDADKENCIVVHPGANLCVSDSVLDAFVGAAAEQQRLCDAVVVLHLEIAHEVVERVADKAANAGALVLFNPSPVPQPGSPLLEPGGSLWPLVDVLVVNEVELAHLCKGKTDGHGDAGPTVAGPGDNPAVVDTANLLDCAAALRQRHCIRDTADIVVTLGKRGAFLAAGCSSSSSSSVLVGAVRVEHVVDTTGAGDCLSGYLAGGLAGGMRIGDALRTAVAAAALCVGRAGAAPSVPDLADVHAVLDAM